MKKIAYSGNDWVGMFVSTNNEHTIIPIDSTKKFREILETNLKTECIPMTVGETNLAGIYLAMNSNGIILPNIATKEEIKELKKTGLNVYVNQDNHNANGNNIAVNDKGGIINLRIDKKEIKKLEDVLGVEIVPRKIAEYTTVGSSVLVNNAGFLMNFRASEDEVKEIEEILKVKGLRGTTNTGTGFVPIGCIANDNGYVVGYLTTAYEMGKVEEALGFLDG